MKRFKIRLCTITLCFLLLPMPVSAASSPTITAALSPIDQNAGYDTTVVYPGTVLQYPLTADMFDWSPSPEEEDAPVTLLQLRRSDVRVRSSDTQSRIIQEITLSTMRYEGQTTACVRVEFAEEFVSVDPREFELTLYLSVGGVRQKASEVILYGDFENEEVHAGSGDNYADLSEGQTLVADDSIANLEIGMGDGVWIFANVSDGRKYYAAAKNEITNADAAMLKKYPAIHTVVRLTTNLIPSGKCVSMEEIGYFYVYDEKGAFLGTTDELVAFSELYYLTDEKIDMGGAADSNPNDSGSAGDKPPSPFAAPPAEQAAKADMAAAAGAAAASGSDTANVMAKDVEKVSSAELEAMYEAASRAKTKARYTVDTTTPGGQIQGRIEINPALAVGLDKDILLGVYTLDPEIDRTIASLNKTYSNRFGMVRLSHPGSYGMTVRVMAKINLENAKMENLTLYYIDRSNNRLNRFVPTDGFLDTNGYLHFSTIYGGDIVASEGLLVERG